MGTTAQEMIGARVIARVVHCSSSRHHLRREDEGACEGRLRHGIPASWLNINRQGQNCIEGTRAHAVLYYGEGENDGCGKRECALTKKRLRVRVRKGDL